MIILWICEKLLEMCKVKMGKKRIIIVYINNCCDRGDSVWGVHFEVRQWEILQRWVKSAIHCWNAGNVWMLACVWDDKTVTSYYATFPTSISQSYKNKMGQLKVSISWIFKMFFNFRRMHCLYNWRILLTTYDTTRGN